MAHTRLSGPDLMITGLASMDLSEPFSPVFHRFRDLPPELRARIWRIAAPRATVVERAMDNTTMSYRLRRHAPVPALLQVCRESRAELLYEAEHRRGACDEQFQLLYLSQEDKARGRGVYVNNKNDTLLIYRAPHKAIMPEAANFSNLRNLAMEWGLRPCWVQNHCDVGVHFIQQFPSLKTLTLLVSFKVQSELPAGDPSSKHREQTQKRRALREIKGWVVDAIMTARTREPNLISWTPPEVRVVPRTKYWSHAAAVAEMKKTA